MHHAKPPTSFMLVTASTLHTEVTKVLQTSLHVCVFKA